MPFDKNIFINCPFNKEYRALLHPMLFTALYFDLEPKISQTRSSANIRIDQIKQYIRESKFAIHDLSCGSLDSAQLPKLNMAYELGLDMGCLEYGGKKLKEKKILILEAGEYRYQKTLSDIAGQDISSHNDDPQTLVKKIRDWFSTMDDKHIYPSANEIWRDFIQFYDASKKHLYIHKFLLNEFEELAINDFIKIAKHWILKIKLQPSRFPHKYSNSQNPVKPFHKSPPRPAPLLRTSLPTHISLRVFSFHIIMWLKCARRCILMGDQ